MPLCDGQGVAQCLGNGLQRFTTLQHRYCKRIAKTVWMSADNACVVEDLFQSTLPVFSPPFEYRRARSRTNRDRFWPALSSVR